MCFNGECVCDGNYMNYWLSTTLEEHWIIYTTIITGNWTYLNIFCTAALITNIISKVNLSLSMPVEVEDIMYQRIYASKI